MELSDERTKFRTKKAPEHAAGPTFLLLLMIALGVDSECEHRAVVEAGTRFRMTGGKGFWQQLLIFTSLEKHRGKTGHLDNSYICQVKK